jgi:hypothetical protein
MSFHSELLSTAVNWQCDDGHAEDLGRCGRMQHDGKYIILIISTNVLNYALHYSCL